MGSGIHIVWGIFRAFDLYRCHEASSFYLCLVIWSWYIGAIIGSFVGGYTVATVRKGHLYVSLLGSHGPHTIQPQFHFPFPLIRSDFCSCLVWPPQFVGGALLMKSGMFLALSDGGTGVILLLARVVGGVAHGLTYVAIIVQASENATKDFRELLLIIVGLVMNYSILISALAFFHTEGLFDSAILNGIGLFAFGVCAMVVAAKHSTETVPFILQTNGSEMDALQTVSKLKKKPLAAQSVHHDFMLMKNAVQDEMDHYGAASFRKILLPENRKSMIFCVYGRLCSVLSFNLPLIVMMLLFLRGWVDDAAEQHGIVDLESHCPVEAGVHIDFVATARPPNSAEIDISEAKIEEGRVKREVPPHTRADDKEEAKSAPAQNNKPPDEASHTANNPKAEHIEPSHAFDEATKRDGHEDKSGDGEADKKAKTSTATHPAEKEASRIEEKPKVEPKQSDTNDARANAANSDKSKTPAESQANGAKKVHATEKQEPNKARAKADTDDGHPRDERNHGHGASDAMSKPPKTEPETSAVERTFYGHLLVFVHSRELTLVLLAWFVFGTVTVAILYSLNLQCYIYYIGSVLTATLALTGLAHSLHFMSTIFHLSLIVYFNYVTIPIDVFGHCMLAEAFPITLKAHSVAGIAALEHFVHIVVIGLYMTEWFRDSIILLVCIVAFVAHEIARNLPQRTNVPLAEARQLYQNVDLMLFNEPHATANYQQQEFI